MPGPTKRVHSPAEGGVIFCCSQHSLTDPSLQDLSERYGFTPATTTSEVQRRLKEEEERFRKEIQKELKIKEGAEKLLQASATGKSNIGAEIKRSNTRLEELNQELEERRTFQLVMSDASFSTPARQPGCGACSRLIWD